MFDPVHWERRTQEEGHSITLNSEAGSPRKIVFGNSISVRSVKWRSVIKNEFIFFFAEATGPEGISERSSQDVWDSRVKKSRAQISSVPRSQKQDIGEFRIRRVRLDVAF